MLGRARRQTRVGAPCCVALAHHNFCQCFLPGRLHSSGLPLEQARSGGHVLAQGGIYGLVVDGGVQTGKGVQTVCMARPDYCARRKRDAGEVSALPEKAGVVGEMMAFGGAARNSICRKAVGVLKTPARQFWCSGRYKIPPSRGGDVGVIHAQGVQVGLNARHFAAVRANGKQVPGVGQADS